MPFADELKPVYEDHVKAVTQRLGLAAVRADDFFAANLIISDVWNAINQARILIADCTGRNPNVFYELGIAHTLGKPVILIAQSADDIPFDIRHIRTILYNLTPRGMRDFESAVAATLEGELAQPRTISEWLARRGLLESCARRVRTCALLPRRSQNGLELGLRFRKSRADLLLKARARPTVPLVQRLAALPTAAGSLSVILGAFVAVLFSEIVSAKCKNAFPGVVLVIDSAAELDVDVAINGQFCPTSPQISVRLIEGLKRRVVQHT